MGKVRPIAMATAILALGATIGAQVGAPGVEPQLAQMTESGHVLSEGRSAAYVIHRLPLNAFPQLPGKVAAELETEGCMIPQTYEAHQPENVVHASLERAGSSDWAVLCDAQGKVSLLVFLASAPEKPLVLATAAETDRLQRYDSSGVLGFNWGIDPATPQQVHDAQTAMVRRPPPPEHDALADSVIDHKTVYHYYAKGKWTLLDMPAD